MFLTTVVFHVTSEVFFLLRGLQSANLVVVNELRELRRRRGLSIEHLCD